ncbi:cell division protein FtsB [Bradyrhizobium sp. USDA 377]
MQRRRSVPHTFEENIAAEKAKLEAQVAKLKPGPQKDALLRKIRQLDTAAHIGEWLSSPGLQPPEPAQNE